MSWAAVLPWKATRAPQGSKAIQAEVAHLEEDQLLMLRVKAGEAEAFNLLMEKYQKPVLNLVYRFTGRVEGAEDLAQEVFLRIYRAAPRYEPRARFFTYLYQVTLNLCRNERDKQQRRGALQASGPEDRPLEVPDAQLGLDERLEQQEVASQVQAALQQLSVDQRELLVMQRFQNLGYEELSQITGQSVSAVKAKLHRARQALKKHLQPWLGKDLL